MLFVETLLTNGLLCLQVRSFGCAFKYRTAGLCCAFCGQNSNRCLFADSRGGMWEGVITTSAPITRTQNACNSNKRKRRLKKCRGFRGPTYYCTCKCACKLSSVNSSGLAPSRSSYDDVTAAGHCDGDTVVGPLVKMSMLFSFYIQFPLFDYC